MKDTVLGFLNQVFFIGIDVHLKSWTVTIRTEGIELKTFRMNPVPEQLAAYLNLNYPGGIFRSVYESGFCGFWIHHKLLKLKIQNIVVNAGDVPTSNRERYHKTDPRDSRKLSRELEKDNLIGIYTQSLEDETLKSLCRLRFSLGKDLTQVKNRISGYMNLYNKQIPEEARWTGRFISKLYKLSDELPNGETLKHLTNSLKAKKQEILSVNSDLKKAINKAGKGNLLKLLRTIPGVGFITAATLITELIDLKRFKNFSTLAAYVGLSPSVESSGDSEKVKGISYRKNKHIMTMLVEASWTAVRKDPVLLKTFLELSKRMKKQKAIIRIAKKLLNRIKAVWLNQTEYKVCYNN